MEALDGNAIGGALIEAFGNEMTDVFGRCRFCGDVSRVAQLRVYMRARSGRALSRVHERGDGAGVDPRNGKDHRSKS